MKRLILLSIVAVLLMTGCAPTLFCHSTKTLIDFERDKYDCENIAFQKAHDFGASGNVFIIVDELQRCLQYKHGWKPCGQR